MKVPLGALGMLCVCELTYSCGCGVYPRGLRRCEPILRHMTEVEWPKRESGGEHRN